MTKMMPGIILSCIAIILAAWMMRYEIVPLNTSITRLDRWTGNIAVCLLSRELRFACGD